MTRLRNATTPIAAATLLALAGCAGGAGRRPGERSSRARVEATAPATRTIQGAPSVVGSPPQALVTAQTEDRLLLVDLPSDQVLKSVTVGGDPEYAAAAMGKGGAVVVVNSASGTVTLLDRDSLRTIKSLGGFASPHIPAISPDDQYAYVTDDARGQVTVIGLYDDKVLSRISVGAGAHHLAFSPDERQVWVALGQSASTIAILSTVVDRPPPPSSPFINLGHPRLIGSFAPGYLAHDLLFAPNGKQVWITSANTSDVGVFSTRTHHLLFRVPAGPPPQHVAFAGRFVYITSGYGSSIEQVALKSGRVLARARAPYGSFDLDATRAYVVAASLLRGTLAVYNPHLGLLRVAHLAPSTEDVVISQP